MIGARSGSRALVVAAAAMVLALAACTQSPNSGGNGGASDTLTWGKPAEILQFDPAVGDSYTNVQFYNLVYDTLTGVGESGEPIPVLAESWEQPADDEYVLKIRQDAVFSNGRELTVDDVVGSLNRVMDPDTGSAWAARLDITSVEAVGEDSVRIRVGQTNPGFLIALANTNTSILPMEELEAGTFDPTTELLGTGPWMVEEHELNQSWTFVLNPNYWGEAPEASTLVVSIITDDSARIAAIRNGNVDVAIFESPDALAVLEGQQDVVVETLDTQDYYRIDVNAVAGPFVDERVRQALALTIDREQLAAVALGGVGTPTAASPVGFGVCDPEDMPFNGPDVDAARALLEEAGAVGTTVRFDATTTPGTNAPMAQFLQQNLEAAGFNVEISTPEFGSWASKWFSGTAPDAEISLSYYGGYGDAAMVLPYFNAGQTAFSAGYQLDNPELNAAIDLAVHTPDGPDRTQAIVDACTLAAEAANVIPLVTKPFLIAYRSDRVEPSFVQPEVYGNALRNIADYKLK